MLLVAAICIAQTLSPGLRANDATGPSNETATLRAEADAAKLFATVKIPPAVSQHRAFAAVEYVLSTNAWQVTRSSGQVCVAELSHREWNATAYVVVEGATIRISERTTKNGQPRTNRGWMQRMKLGIVERLALEARNAH